MPAGVSLEMIGGGGAVVWLDRPEKRNAFDAPMIAALQQAFENVAGDASIRILGVRGRGGSFCTGADVDWMRAQGRAGTAENIEDALGLARMLKALNDLPQLSVALIEGPAMGGGAGLVAACDMALACADASFRFSEVRLGLTPATISPYVIEAIGPRAARALFASAEGFDAAFAARIGLVSECLAGPAELEARFAALQALSRAAAPGAVRDAKALVRDVAGRPLDEALLQETARRIAQRRADSEGREGLSAFLEKRKANWA